MPGPFYFALVDSGDVAFNPAVHNVNDLAIFNASVDQNEADIAGLKVVVANPRVGLLAEGSPLWAWFSWFDGTAIVPLFFGRLVGIPEDLHAEVVSLAFHARPADYDEQKAALAEALKALPYWDPVFIQADQRDNPDAVLEGRTALWHVDRVTHEVTISDIVEGEDGGAVVTDHFYDSLQLSYREAPATAINCKATIQYKQQAGGVVDFTDEIYKAFLAEGSAEKGFLKSYTGGGLLSTWPKPGTSIGGGWSVGTSFIARIDGQFAPEWNYVITVATGGVKAPGILPTVVTVDTSSMDEGDITFEPGIIILADGSRVTEAPLGTLPAGYMGESPDDTGGPMNVGFPLWCMSGVMYADYKVARDRVEVVTFTMTADVQPLISDEVEALKFEVSTKDVDQPVDLFDVLEPGTGTGYQINRVGGYPAGTSTLLVDTGTGTILTGDSIIFADGQRYRVTTGLSDGRIVISPPLWRSALNNAPFSIDQTPRGGLPIGDTRRASYMLTDRGHQSLEYLIAVCRAHLTARARAVTVACEIPFDAAIPLTLRQSRTIVDDRLPGGQATGKVTSYRFSVDGDSGTAKGVFSIGCTVGRGAVLTVPAGIPTYVADGYVADGYQVRIGGGTLVASDVYYDSFDHYDVDDDGVDFFNMRAADVVESLAVINGSADQEDVLKNGPTGTPPVETSGWVSNGVGSGSGGFGGNSMSISEGGSNLFPDSSSALSALNEAHTQVAMALTPLTYNQPFETTFAITVSPLAIPKTLDLEVAA
jgi:hypothetical protein